MNNIVIITLFSFVLNIPFGYFRRRSRKFSVKWFVFVHMPVPLIIAFRILSHTELKFIPLFVIASVAGQFVGGRIGPG